EHDFAICREESIRAVEWYRQYRFPIESMYVTGLGHERVPQVASAFFASVIGETPKTPPELGTLVLKDIPMEELRGMSVGSAGGSRPPPGSGDPAVTGSSGPRRPPGDVLFNSGEASPSGPTRVAPAEPVRRTPPTV